MAIVDNAGVFLERVDKSQSPVDVSPDALNCAFCVNSERGFVGQVYTINDTKAREDNLGVKDYRVFGTSLHDLDKYLEARNPAFVVRAGDPTWANAGLRISISGSTVTVAAGGITQAQIGSYTGNELFQIFAKGEGDWGNNIQTEVVKNTVDLFEPGDSARLSTLTITIDSIVVETWTISPFETDIDNNGASLFLVSVLAASRYISADAKDGNFLAAQLEWTIATLAGGNSIATINKTNFLAGLKLILDFPDRFDCFLTVNAGAEIDLPDFSAAITFNGRVFGCGSSISADALDASLDANDFVIARAAGHGGDAAGEYPANNPFLAICPQWVLTADTDRNTDVFISPAGYLANVIASQSNNGQLFFAPAGPIRGNLPGAKNVSRVWEGQDRVTLVTGQWNPIKSDKRGITFWDQLTTQTVKTAYSDIHVALSFLAFARAIPATIDASLFEFNDQENVDAVVLKLEGLADLFIQEKAAEEIEVHDDNNIIGSDEMLINWEWRPKGVTRKIKVRVTAYPATQELSVSLA